MGRTKKAQQTLFDFEQGGVIVEKQPYQTPKNWIWSKIKAVCNVYTGNSINETVKAQKYAGQKEGLLFIATKDVDFNGRINYETNVRINDYENFKIAPANTALLCIEGGSAGRKVGFTEEQVCFGNKLCAFNTSSINSKMVFYFLQCQCFCDQFNGKKHGLIGGVSISDLSEIYIPLPPLPEQKRIVELIESLFSRLDEARAKAQEVIDGFEPWKSAILHKAITGQLVEQRSEEGTSRELLKKVQLSDKFGGQKVKQKNIKEISEDEKTIVIPPNWEWVKLGSVCIIARGGSPRPIKDFITTSDDGVNWIKIGDTQKNGKYISTCAEKIKPSGVSKSRMVHAGDFLLTNSMSFGRPYILKISGCIHDGWLVISQPSEVFDQDFLYWLLSSSYAFSQFCGQVSGAVVENLNSDKVANSVFPLPPLPEQKRIVSQIESLISRMEEAVEKAKSVIEQIDVIKKSILAKAFRGELGTNDPTEESALEILKSSGAERKKRAS